jgi:hypothetical protein
MLFGDKKLYEQARAAKLGKLDLIQPLEYLRRWLNENYKVNVLHVVYDLIDLGPHEGRPRLNIILETAEHYAKLHKDPFSPKPHIKKAISKRFAKIVAASSCDHNYDTANVHVTFDDFSDEAMGQAVTRFQENDKHRLLKEFAPDNVWDISGFSKSVVVFYLTNEDMQSASRNGTNDRIKQRCYELVKQYDEFDYFELETFPITFDSKQNLDENYQGSMFYYFR